MEIKYKFIKIVVKCEYMDKEQKYFIHYLSRVALMIPIAEWNEFSTFSKPTDQVTSRKVKIIFDPHPP